MIKRKKYLKEYDALIVDDASSLTKEQENIINIRLATNEDIIVIYLG